MAGTLDFYWRITVDPTSTDGGIQQFRLGNFDPAQMVDGDCRQDAPESTPASWAIKFDPVNAPQGNVNFYFVSVLTGDEIGIAPGDPASNLNGSHWFFLHTVATQYAKTASYDLIGGGFGLSNPYYNATFAPVAVPEPAALLLIATGGWVLLPSRRRSVTE